MMDFFDILIGIVGSIILYLVVRPIATLGYMIWYRDLPNFKAYFNYSEKAHLIGMEKYYVYANFFYYVKGIEPLEFYGAESKVYRYFPKTNVEFS
jgi:hypothetical protein